MAGIAKALADPVRLQLVDVLRKHAGKVCVCELVPLFDLSQPTVSHHLKVLREAGHRRLRAPGPVGLLLRHPRRAEGAVRMAELTDTDIREQVRERYAAAATAAATNTSVGLLRHQCLRGLRPRHGAHRQERQRGLRRDALRRARPMRAPKPRSRLRSAAACPTAVADLHEGETVLDLGSGAGADVLISARRVGPTGKAIGLDMTDEMLELARANAAEAGVDNVEFVKGYIEEIPLRRRVRRRRDLELRDQPLRPTRAGPCARPPASCGPGGRFAVSDVIADPDMDDATRADMQQWTGCIAGALTRGRVRGRTRGRRASTDIEIRETHRVHEHACSAIVRARKPQA